jgi:hypothetical protein
VALLTPSKSPINTLQPIEIVYQNETKKTQAFVTAPDEKKLDEQLEDLKEKAQQLSRITQRVKEQMVARKNGETRNREPAPQQQMHEELQKPLETSDAPSITAPMPDKVARNTYLGDSSIAEYIPEVKEGGFTALNTDQFVYYTFYARTNEQVRNRWVNNVQQFINDTPQSELNRLAQKTQVSQIEIILTRDGKFVKALAHKNSESRDLDACAAAAFRLAAPFNNPPSEMIEEDGFIHLHYGFHIQLQPRYLASGSK